MKHKGPPVMNDRERYYLLSSFFIIIRRRTYPNCSFGNDSRAMVDACKWADEVAWGTPYDPSIELLVCVYSILCRHI
jgi:glycerol-3-phosphate cytidylyltransferase-like family protein